MLIRLLKILFADGKVCPKCGETQDIDVQNGIWHCYRCGHEW